MRRLFLLSIFLISGILMQAQTADKKWGLGLGGGVYGNLETDGVGFMPELYLSRYVSPSFDVLFQESLGLFNSKVTNDLDLSNFVVNLRYKLYNGKLISESSVVKPYLYAGVGYLFDNDVDGANFDAGIGTKFAISPNTALFVEGGYISGVEYEMTPGNKVTENLWKVVGGIEFSFGKAKDSDGDGVSDKKDNCPDTPVGVSVDENGCPIDSDGDGVVDYLDDCPQEAGLTSLKGCPDADNDGIADKDDACPDVAGLKEFKGCPDTDGDGVVDSKDKCGDTPAGWKVDANGCPLDTDGDGVVDAEDDCPTVAGLADNKGCPKKEPVAKVVDVEVKPIYFPLNQSYVTDYSKQKLDELLQLLSKESKYKINLFGYTDDLATEEYNLKLSQDRVNSVVKYLTGKGLDKSRIDTTKALGEENPAVPNTSEENRKLNRRVEFKVFVTE